MMRRSLAVLGVALAAAFTMVSPASAQQGYPPGPCVPVNTTQNFGVFAVGQTLSFKLTPTCAFTAGSAVTVTVNGVNIPGKVAEGDGTLNVQIQVTSATTALVDDPVPVPNICGTNTIVANGPSLTASGGRVTVNGLYTVNCAAPAVVTPGVVTPVAVATGQLGRTGSDVGKWIGLGAALIVVGFGTVFFVRRRHAATA